MPLSNNHLSFVPSTPVLSALTSDLRHVVYENPHILHYLGVSRLNGVWESLVHPEDRPILNEAIAETLETGADTVINQRMLARDGQYHRVVGNRHAHYLPNGDLMCYQVSFRDADLCSPIPVNPAPRLHRVPRVGFDVDAVLRNATQVILDVAAQEDVPGYGSIFDWKRCYTEMPHFCRRCAAYIGDGPEVIDSCDSILNQALLSNQELFANALAYPGVDFYSLNQAVKNNDITLYLVNSSHTLGDDIRMRDWLRSYELTEYQVLLPEYCQQDKADFLRQNQLDFFLTDKLELVTQLRAFGVEAFLIDRPWNRHIEMPFRLHSLDEFLAETVYAKRGIEAFHTVNY